MKKLLACLAIILVIVLCAFGIGYVNPDVIPEEFISDIIGNFIDTPVEDSEPSKESALDYMTKYSVIPVEEFYDIFRIGDRIYIRYAIAEVKDATLSELGRVHNSGGIQSISVTTSDSWSSLTEEALTNTIHDVVTWGISGSLGASASVPVSIAEVGVNFGISGGYNHVTETTTTESIKTVVSSAHEEVVSYDIDLTQYPVDNKYYRVAMKGDCILVQTLVYDLSKQKLDTSRTIIDCVVIGSPQLVIESSEYENNFAIPESYSNEVNIVTSVDLTGVLTGSGTTGSPYQISSEEECLYVIMNPAAYYKLTEDIEMDNYLWFDYDKYWSQIDLNGHHIFKPGSERNPYLIASADDFLKIYKEPNAHYKLTDDISFNNPRMPPQNIVFSGYLDGNNHKIICNSGEDITIGTDKYSHERSFGLFSENRGTIENLVLQGFSIRSGVQHSGTEIYVGCIAGKNSGKITNVNVIDGLIECQRAGSDTGMITGWNMGTIENCQVIRGCIISNGDAGGIAGRNSGTIIGVTVEGNGTTGDNVEEYMFMDHFNVAWTYGDHAGLGKGWGGIVGHADASSYIRDVMVKDVFIRGYMSGATGASSFGYVVGYNSGRIMEPCIVSNCSNKYGHGPIGGLVSAHHWFRIHEGAVGQNSNGSLPSGW